MSSTDIEDILSLSPIQKGLLFHSLYAPDAGVYFQQVNCVLRGKLDLQAFRQAWQQTINRHSILRTSFFWEDLEEPVQIVNREVTLPIEIEDWSELADSEQQSRLQNFLEEDRRRGFELSQAPLLRLALLRLDEQRYRLVWSHHHLLLDGWSIPLLLKEVFTVYRGLCWKEPVQLAQARPYRDYITWLQRQSLEEAERYWREKLRGLKSPTTLGQGRGREARAEGEGEYREQRLNLSAAETAELSAVARSHQVTLNTVVQGAWGLLLSRYSGEREVLFGTTVAGRPADLRGVEQMVGVFINTLPMRVRIDEKKPVSEWLQDLQAEAVEMRQYEYSPLVEVAKWSEMPRGTALFESLLVFDNYPVNSNGSAASSENGKSDIPTIEDVSHYRRVNYPLMLTVAPREELKWWLSYEADTFDDETIARMMRHLQQLLRAIATNPQQRISDLSLLTESERHQLLVEFNDTEAEFPQGVCLHHLIQQQARRTPEQVALVFEEEKISYRELNERANQLAHHLRSLNVGPEARVGILLERSVEMIVALLGVLKAGGAYVPLDPAYPSERLQFMLADAAVRVLLTEQRLSNLLPAHDAQVIYLDQDNTQLCAAPVSNPHTTVAAENLAYVIYTSGSTGTPKGVAITHRSAATMLYWAQEVFSAEQLRGVLASTSINFDLSVFEIFLPLSVGGKIILARSALELPELPAKDEVSLINTVPSAIAELIRSDGMPETVQTVNLAGEALKSELVKQIYEQSSVEQVWNLYGPTEDTTYSTYALISKDNNGRVTIGRPVACSQVYLLDRQLEPVPVGITAELYLGGEGLARGYLGRPELTAERFIPDPFGRAAGGRLYRTGDLARYLPDGNIEYLGRVDHQVKIRGYRIELGEVEAALRRHDRVRDCVVVAREEVEDDKRLVAYVVDGDGPALDAGELRRALKERLPEYMIPSQFVMMEAFPLTPNGKVDRQALPAPGRTATTSASGYVAPRTPVEELLAGIWAEVLRVERVGLSDNLFELGGHSLMATQIISRVREAFGVELPMRSIFESPTVEEMAQRIEERKNQQEAPAPPVKPVPRDADLPLSFAQQRLWVFDRMAPGRSVYNIPLTTRLREDLDIAVLQRTFAEIIRRHESLRTTFGEVNGQPRQIISPPPATPPPLPIVDLSYLSEEIRVREARRLAQQEARRPFNLAHGPLIRAGLIKLDDEEYMVLLTMHHIVSDGWSMGVLLNEVTTLYAAFRRGEPSPLPEPMIQYADYAVWQREWLQGEVLEKQLSYWRQHLEGAPALLELPADKPRPAIPTFRGASESLELSPELTAKLKELSRQHNVTLFMVLLATFQLLLHRYTGNKDIVVGSPIAGRTHVETESLIGFLVNTLALRARFTRELTFEELLRQVREVTLGAYAHQELPFESMVELQSKRNLSYNPLIQVMFALQNIPQTRTADAATNNNGAEAPPPLLQGTTKFDMSLRFRESDGGLKGSVEYNTDLFSAPRAQRLAGHYKQLLNAVVSNPQQRISELALLTETEQQQLLQGFNDTAQALPQDLCAHQLFEAQVAKTPEAVALVHEEEQLSYAELNGRANQLAHYLRSNGVGVETVVGLCLPRGINQTVALLGVLKSGAAYLPLEPGYSPERLASLLDETGAALVLTDATLAPSLPQGVCQLVFETVQPELDQLPASDTELEVAPESLAYITRGIAITQAGLLSAVQSSAQMLGLTASDRVLDLSSPARDSHLLTAFATLLRGATLSLSATDKANVLSAPVARFLELGREELAGVNTVILYGEGFSPRLLHSLRGKRLLHVRELPTAALFQLSREYHKADPKGPMLIPYERGSQVECYVLDKEFQPVPMGVTGELFISVGNRQRGYLSGADQTAAAFVPNPFSNQAGSRLYASGWRVRLDADGKLQCLGNLHDQVVIDGDHISLKEIEAIVTQQSAVRHTVIKVDEDEGQKSVIAYVTPDHTAVMPPALGDLSNVTDYLRPAAYVVLDQLPLSAEGEVELAALPKAEVVKTITEYVAPQSPVERIVAKIWMDVLEVEKISVHDNFFSVGGHSLLATMANVRISDTFGIEVPVNVLFEAPTVAEFANKLLQDPSDGERIEQIAALQISMEEMANKVRTLMAKEQPAKEKQAAPEKQAEPEKQVAPEKEAAPKKEAAPEKEVAAEKQAARVKQTTRKTQASLIKPAPRDADLPLSFAQQQLWVFDRMAPGSSVYNIPITTRLTPDLNLTVLQRTYNEILRRHESLRTTFREVNGQPRQIIAPPASAPLPVVDLSSLPKEIRERESRRLAQQEGQRPFDLTRGPLIRAQLLNLGEQGYKVLWTMHHIVFDGWSVGVLLNEVSALYEAFSRGKSSPLPEPVIQYADYAVWQREWLQGEALDKQVSYWREHLQDVPAMLELPADKPRPAVPTFRGASESMELSAELTAKLKELSYKHNVTLFMILLAAFELLLHRYTGQEQVVVGSPIAGRTRVGTESLIGLFVNTLVLRGRFSRDLTFEGLLRQVREGTLGAYAHQELPFENLVEELQPERNLSYNPLVQVMFVLQNIPLALKPAAADSADAADTETNDSAAEAPPPLLQGTAKFDTLLWMRESEGVLRGGVEYSTDLFSAERVQRLTGHYKQLLTAIVNNPRQRISELPLLTKTEQQLLNEFNNPAPALPQDLCAHQLFEAQVAKTPEAVALVHEDDELTYAELNERANQLAHYLRDSGAGAETVVGLCLPAGINQIVALLGVLKSGAAYLPLEPAYPAERLASLLEEAGAALVLTDATLASNLPPGVRQLVLETVQPELAQLPATDNQFEVAPESLAYITKGIAITQAGLLSAMHSSTDRLGLTASDRVLDLSSPARDSHLLTAFATLLRGATLSLSTNNEANVLSAPVTRFLELGREELAGLSTVILYGEGFSPRLVDSLSGKRLLHVRELPSATLFQLSREYYQAEQQWPMLIPYERDSQVEFHVLDKEFQPVPMGVTGELFIAVGNRQRGYVQGADRTAAAFVPNPFSSQRGSRLYASGCQVRLDINGQLQYLGNLQDQVEIGSHHISLKEIEAVVTQQSAARYTVIKVDEEEGQKSLIAYVVPDDTAATQPALSDVSNVTDYLRPAAYVVLDQLPLSAEGEVELEALPKAEVVKAITEYVAPRDPLELVLAKIWMDILEVEKISVHDNFFRMGGHSLLGTMANVNVSDAFGIEVPITVLFEAPTIAEFANKLRQDPNDGPRFEEIAALLVSVDEMSDEAVKALIEKEQAA